MIEDLQKLWKLEIQRQKIKSDYLSLARKQNVLLNVKRQWLSEIFVTA